MPTLNTSLTDDIRFHPSEEQKQAPHNRIVSTHSKKWAYFVPKVIFQWLKNLIIIFYIVNMCLQFESSIRILDPAGIYLPLLIILTADTIKEGVMEYRRWRDDKQVNHATCKKVSAYEHQVDKLKYTSVQSQDLKVGDIILLKDEDHVPADCIVL